MLFFLVRFMCQFDFMNNKYDVRFIAIDLFFTFHKNPVCQFCICLLLFFHLSLIYFVCHLNFFFCCLTKMWICRSFKLRTEWLIIIITSSSRSTFTLLKWKWFCCCLLTLQLLLWLLVFFLNFGDVKTTWWNYMQIAIG